MAKTHGYAPVNGLQMYYEIDGEGEPLVFIRRHLAVADVHAVPALVRTHRVITFDLQSHGRTADLPDRPMSLQQNARDVIELLRQLDISKADFLGENSTFLPSRFKGCGGVGPVRAGDRDWVEVAAPGKCSPLGNC